MNFQVVRGKTCEITLNNVYDYNEIKSINSRIYQEKMFLKITRMKTIT